MYTGAATKHGSPQRSSDTFNSVNGQPDPTPSLPITRRSASTALRVVAIGIIVFGPILAAKWEMRRAASAYAVPAVEPGEAHARAVADYLATRNPAVDSLLPEGEGGTRLVPSLDSVAGRAISATATILLASGNLYDAGSIELHERAHLMHAYLPAEVAQLLARLPRPAAGSYAATNSQEHFAEMAAAAWSIVSPPGDVCLIGTPVEQLRASEQRVPGTAGFVLWYLRSLVRQHSDTTRDLLAESMELAAPLSAEWDTIWAALEKRRLAGGTFEPWKAPDLARHLELWRAGEWNSNGWLGKVMAILLAPSTAVARVF